MGKVEDNAIPIQFPNVTQRSFPSYESQNKRNTNTKKNYSICNLLKVYFDCAFIVGVSPFRIVNNGKTNQDACSNGDNSPNYLPKTNKIQQVSVIY